MRLLYLLSILLLSAVPAQAQTCTSAPSCAALGYDKTSTDCTGQAMLKCPFDQSKVFCAGTSACGGSTNPDGSGCNVGDILYSDFTCSPNSIYGKVAIGVVFYNRHAVALKILEHDTYENIENKVKKYSTPGTAAGQWQLLNYKVKSAFCDNWSKIKNTSKTIGRELDYYSSFWTWESPSDGTSCSGGSYSGSEHKGIMVLPF